MTNPALVYITSRSLSMFPSGHITYHWPAHWGRTWCGRSLYRKPEMWDFAGVMVRRDTADLIADPCQRCYPEGRPL
jgi:hypothetical protein